MLQKYKEIFYGLLFGLGAAILDIMMDARAEGVGVGTEVTLHPAMLLYRSLFVLFGLILGWLLWQKNRRERDFRNLAETLKRFRQDYRGIALVMHTRLQVLLTRENLNLPQGAEELIRAAYQSSQELQNLVNTKLPADEFN